MFCWQSIVKYICAILLCYGNFSAVAESPKENSKPIPIVLPPHQLAVRSLLERLRSKDEATVVELALQLQQLTEAGDLPLLLEALKESGGLDEMRITLIELLGMHCRGQEKEVLKALNFEYSHGTPEVKIAAVRSAGFVHDDVAIPFLSQVLRGTEELRLRRAAATALSRINTPQAIYALETSKSTYDEDVNRAVTWALRESKGEIDRKAIDRELPDGRKLLLNYLGTLYYLYYPGLRFSDQPKPRILIVVHDERLNPETVFDVWLPVAKKEQIALLAPLFDDFVFPDYGTFNIRGERSDLRLLQLLQHVSKTADLDAREVYLFGLGAGGDFVHRLHLAHPQLVARSAFFAQSFTMPSDTILFPLGVKVNPRAPDVQINPYYFVKSDVAVFLPIQSDQSRQPYRFFEAYIDYAVAAGVTPRLVSRKSFNLELNLTIPAASEYLFYRDKGESR